MLKHLDSCKKRALQNKERNATSKPSMNLIQLMAYYPYTSEFWLYLEVKSAATLKDLDFYLRQIWLECCGHLSQFCHGSYYGNKIPMSSKAYKIFEPDTELFYAYDFGSTTELKVKMVGSRNGTPLSNNPVYLLARNNMPDVPCDKCGKPSGWLDLEALYENGEFVTLCDAHNAGKAESDYGESQLFNSPRTGTCSYDGPAVPPY
ncbi:hypothetical protein CYPRO_1175 [Cyclonatronum proteinivorum]|uniref:Uncharacterized protein n=2 Tax=Cyclonatronum proteinivorum TaxID=1457365 RepID=A0A345UIY7_9BACT|nr:hypothetical protein CYPRO_1175 [Cyclonatronum proteinivorum]